MCSGTAIWATVLNILTTAIKILQLHISQLLHAVLSTQSILQRVTFLEGAKGPDFQDRDNEKGLETTYENRATEEDLSEIGKRQMGFIPFTVEEDDDERTKRVVAKCNAILGF
jgi:hypothetical protein